MITMPSPLPFRRLSLTRRKGIHDDTMTITKNASFPSSSRITPPSPLLLLALRLP